MTGRTLGKVLLYLAGACIGLVLLSMIAVKLVLDRAPAYQNEIESWVHAQTGYHIRFAHVWPAFRWYGPELYFDRLELRSTDDRRVLARAAGGRIAVDVWQLLRSGRLLAGRIELDAPEIVVARVGPDRFALAAEIELRGGNGADAAHPLQDLPAGNLSIRRGSITVERWNAVLPRLVLADVELRARRAGGAISLDLAARLPPVLGGTLRVAGAAQGGGGDGLAWHAAAHARGISFAGWHLLLPDILANLRSGGGAFDLDARGFGWHVGSANLDFDAAAVVTKLPDESGAAFDRISGKLALQHDADRWTLRGRDVRAQQSGHRDPVSQFDVRWRGAATGLLDLSASTSYLHADSLMPLTGLLPDETLRAQLRDLAPTGEWSDASLDLSRAGIDRPWRLAVRAAFKDAGFAPLGRAPGLRGLSGSIAGTETGGRLDLDARMVAVAWPRQWPEPVSLDSLKGTVFWRRSAEGLLVATPALLAANRDASVQGQGAWQSGADADSPRMTFVVGIADGNMAAARRYLPRAQLPPKTIAWLNRAFVVGRMPHATVVFRGPVRHFPFRDGSGIFSARLAVEGLVLDYNDGWPRLENMGGRAEFRNEGLTVHLRSATAGSVAIDAGEARFADFKTGELEIHASASGDAAAALELLRATPLDALTGNAFSAVDARGPMSAHLQLDFPFKQFDRRRVLVDGHLDGVALNLRGSPVQAADMLGDFSLDGPQVARADLRGRLLGGTFRMLARAPRNAPVSRTQLDFHGSADGETVRTEFGLPPGLALRGTAEWRALLRMSPAPERERSLRISSNLAGWSLGLPAPFAKSAPSALPSTLELQWPPEGGAAGRFTLGPIAHGVFEIAADARGWHLARAAVGFGGAEAAYGAGQIIGVGGRIARLDLSGWQRFRSGDENARPLAYFLHSARLQIGELDYLGQAFNDLAVDLAGTASQWRVAVDGPQIAGTIIIPTGPYSAPWDLDFTRLRLGDPADASPSGPAASTDAGPEGGAEPAADPRSVPAIRFHAGDMSWGSRHFGTVQAVISKDDDGVTLDRLTAISPSFSVTASGEWRGKGAGLGRVQGALDSTDVETTLTQLGYADVISARDGRLDFDLRWVGAPTADSLSDAAGRLQVALDKGQVLGLKPGAGRVLGLSSIAALPRRLALDFSDLTDKGLAFDSVRGHFNLRGGSAHTDDVLLKGPAAEIGLLGRIGLKSRDYDQIAVVTGSIGNSLAGPLAGALAGGPVVAAAVLVFTQVFKQPLRGLARGYYRITGGWDNPTVDRIKSADVAAATAEVAK